MSLPVNPAVLPLNLRIYRRIVLASFIGLLALFFVNSLLLTIRPGLTSLIIWLIQTTPLLIFIPGLARNHLRAYAWLSFVCLMYFIHAVLTAFNPASRTIGALEVALCTALFTGLILYIRNFRMHYKVSI